MTLHYSDHQYGKKRKHGFVALSFFIYYERGPQEKRTPVSDLWGSQTESHNDIVTGT